MILHLLNFELWCIVSGNDIVCHTIGIRYFGQICSMELLELVNVKHDLQKDLISLGMLEAKGYEIVLENGVFVNTKWYFSYC